MWKRFFTFLVRFLQNERGEIADDLNDQNDTSDADNDNSGADDDDGSFTVDLDRVDDDNSDSDPDDDSDDDDDSPDLQTVLKDYEDLKKNYESLQTHKTDLDKAIHGLRQELKTLRQTKDKTLDDGKETEFTDAQLLGLMEQHRDDPATLLQIMRYEAKQAAKKAGDKATSDVDLANKKKDADSFLTKMYPDFNNEGSEIRNMVNQAKTSYGLDDHPLGDLFSAGVLALQNMGAIVQAAREQGKKEALGEKNNAVRKQDIKGKQPASKGNKPSGEGDKTLSGQVLETAKQFGFNKSQMKIYQKMLANKNKAAVEV